MLVYTEELEKAGSETINTGIRELCKPDEDALNLQEM